LVTSTLLLSDLPVLFVDTCSILDIVRDPSRDSAKPHEMQAAIDIVCAAEADTIHCFMAEQVAIEFEEHNLRVQEEAKQKLRKTQDQIARINKLAAVLGATKDVDLTHLDDYVSRTRSVVNRWVAQLQTINPSEDAPGRAFGRMNAKKAPAIQGKESSKDCLVYETVLEKATAIHAVNCSSPMVFVSSNTKDYCTYGSIVKDDIATDFDPLNLKFAPNMAAAKHLLGL
jgi:ribosomal protein L9